MVRPLRFLAAAAMLAIPTAATAAPATKDLGFNVHQSTDVGMNATRDTGAKWVRVDFNWLDAEPTAAGQYDWSRFDAIVNAAQARSLNVPAVLAYTPTLGSQGNKKGAGRTKRVPQPGTVTPFLARGV